MFINRCKEENHVGEAVVGRNVEEVVEK